MTYLPQIQRLADSNDVRVSVRREDGKRVIGLHGYASDVEAVLRQIHGFWAQRADSGVYLYR